MGRFMRKHDAGPRHKQLDAWARGLGFITLVVLSVGGYWLADVTLRSAWLQQQLPQELGNALREVGGDLWIPIHKSLPIQFPAHVLLRIGIAVFLDVLAYTLLMVVWAMINRHKTDVPDDPWASQGRG